MNISSIVVQTRPENLEQVVADLKACEVCDYHLHDEKGRVIVTIEGESVKEELQKLRVIEEIKNVVSADMQMAYSEDELEQNVQVLNSADAVPQILDRDDIDPTKIVYHGDLKGKEDLDNFAKSLDEGLGYKKQHKG